MKSLLKYTICCLVILSGSCKKKDFLERQSQTLLAPEQVFNDPLLITGVLANYYNRLPADASLTTNWQRHATYDDAIWGGGGNAGDEIRNSFTSYATDTWRSWNYGFIRDINLALENMESAGTKLTTPQKSQFNAEFRFLRAFTYFDMVKRMGGVPIVTTTLTTDKGDYETLRRPRDTEAAVYDFIAAECDAIKDNIGNGTSQTRANKFAVLALKSRAMLYAGSIARYNSLLAAPITLPGGVVGIPSEKASDYYQKALDASKEIINSGTYTLYNKNPNPGDNFFEAITKKGLANTEVILAQDFLQAKGRNHTFSYDNIARGIREDNLGSSAISPTLNLVESFEYLDGTPGVLRNRTADNSDYIYYDKLDDIFANKDGRLHGTVMLPGTTFKGARVSLQAGLKIWNPATNTYTTSENSAQGVETFYTDGKLWTGSSGPVRSGLDISNTGFNLKKFIDPLPGSSNRGQQSDIWWIRFRLGEVLLNAGEAAFELGRTGEALGYINKVRERAGFTTGLTTLTIDRIRNERRVELAFEDHRVWDLIRWRIAHILWNGNTANPDANLFALYPYRVIRPGDPARHDKYVFDKIVAPRFRAARFFQINNYYSSIAQGVIDANPLIIRNPGH
ncbi:RagB/SusD family nutrient uptake outer membrane protein [Segetibacter sp. 3557_3]|uniref:RagB/SusD family nutrient uptake outer membrane protein n=1 Tax=Segetibacter sp. 3557_3 TaxID=2547429 RepID=UPI0010585360|nr:RagB/SusD family nutrient uptake outer membrane protein [Segetibacter sp. 3557_3]TDH29067.1 RagB/SusD family nutrient uptake outer membrane protein [Segetibacter sp. 3557_3]